MWKGSGVTDYGPAFYCILKGLLVVDEEEENEAAAAFISSRSSRGVAGRKNEIDLLQRRRERVRVLRALNRFSK